MKGINNEAVSPVVGVMLMLVVTIIIAAVVSGFAGGLAGNQKMAPQVTITAEPVVKAFLDLDKTNSEADYGTSDFTANNGIEFENTGGDSFSLTDIDVQLSSGTTKYTLSYIDQVDYSSDWTCLEENITAGVDFEYDQNYVSVPIAWNHFAKIGGSSLQDISISPGDKFMLYACGCYDTTDSAYGPSSSNGKYLVWEPKGTINGFGAQFGKEIGYKLIDKDSAKIIASGAVVFK
ncbi:type IV pilin N-terminal domain-containing protein [Methanomicrobium antiquum]|uniref:Type IV pilin N-terminal domain-containing protein n=1 Tax=Methanomicrobium antiquum TaxID=487686 RepID=A0AAF0FN08_9EURY|nr:type IV pilin N-terminal domain-containing protein [Methanomicrobium antiquum]WFN37308.1 type IV pilin N-terminal domain-containing protein [Methanomicrobium antiquum]